MYALSEQKLTSGEGVSKKRRCGEGCCYFTPSYAPYFFSPADLQFAVCLLHWLKCQVLRPTCSGKKSFPLKRGSNDRVVVAHHKLPVCVLLKKLFNATMILAVKPRNQSIELWKNTCSYFTNYDHLWKVLLCTHTATDNMKCQYDATFLELFHNLFLLSMTITHWLPSYP